MQTKTEMQLILTNGERRKLEDALDIINLIRYICNLPIDEVTFRCWDIEHDYVEYKYEQLADFTRFITDIVKAEEIGFNHIEKGQTDD